MPVAKNAKVRTINCSATTLGLLALLALLPLGSTAQAEPQRWTLLDETSRLLFSVQVMGGDFAGSFDKYSADIVFSPEEPAAGSIDVSVDMAATSTGMGEADSALPTDTWFDVAQYASGQFVARNIKATDDGFVGDAVLTVKGKSVELPFPFSWTASEGGARLESEVTLDRRSFAVGTDEYQDDEDTVGFEVTVHVDVYLQLQD